jgi:hypothetical protein
MLFIRMTNYISICNLVTVALDLNQHLEDSKSHDRFSFGWNLQLHPWLYIGLKVLKHFLISLTNSNFSFSAIRFMPLLLLLKVKCQQVAGWCI